MFRTDWISQLLSVIFRHLWFDLTPFLIDCEMRGDDLKWSSDYNQSWLLVTDELTSVVLSTNNFKIKARKKDFHFYQVYQAPAPHLGECYQGWLARSSDKNDGWCSADDISGVMSLITSHQLMIHFLISHLDWIVSCCCQQWVSCTRILIIIEQCLDHHLPLNTVWWSC